MTERNSNEDVVALKFQIQRQQQDISRLHKIVQAKNSEIEQLKVASNKSTPSNWQQGTGKKSSSVKGKDKFQLR